MNPFEEDKRQETQEIEQPGSTYYPINGEAAVQEALRQKAAEEEEWRQREEAAREAQRLAEENRRAAEEWKQKQRLFQEEQARLEAEKKEKRRKLRGRLLGALAAVFCIGAFVFGWVNLQENRKTKAELTSLQAQVNQYSNLTVTDVSRLPQGSSVDAAQLTLEDKTGTASLTNVADMVEETIRSVVSIKITKKVKLSTGFFGDREYTSSGAGSGVIIGDNGTELWIVTNAHVVDEATDIAVILADDSQVTAYVKGTSEENDIAVLGVALENLSESTKQSIRTAAIGSSETLRLGEGVVAIGNAMGWGQSVTTGVVSALSRDVEFSDGITMNLLQISAAINPGNSGGALLNARGELIGINNAKYSSEEVEGVGFAIPISSIVDVMEELSLMQPRVKVSEAEMPYLGITFQNYPSGYLAFYNVPEGAVIHEVVSGSPADAAGLLAYDVITAIEGHTIRSYADLMEELQYYKGGTEVEIRYMRLSRGSYQEETARLTLGFKAESGQ